MNIKKSFFIILISAALLCLALSACKGNESQNEATLEATSQAYEVEENTKEGSGFEENEPLDESDEAGRSSNSNSSSNSNNENALSSDGAKESPADSSQSTTEKISEALPPRATEQDGEWGAPVKN